MIKKLIILKDNLLLSVVMIPIVILQIILIQAALSILGCQALIAPFLSKTCLEESKYLKLLLKVNGFFDDILRDIMYGG